MLPASNPRSYTITWQDPMHAAAQGHGLSGLEHLQGIVGGAIPQPPLGAAMGFALVEVRPGFAVFECAAAEHHYNLIGSIHGGLAATLIDSASGCAVMSCLEAGQRWTTIHLEVDYLRPLGVDSGRLRCIGTALRVGRRVGIADAELRGPGDKLFARGTSRCLVVPAG